MALKFSIDNLETAASSGCQFCTLLSRFLSIFRKLSPRVKVQVEDSVVTGDLILSYSLRVWKYARIDAADTLGKLTTLGGSMKLASLPGNRLELWRVFLFREILSFSTQRILLASLK